MKLFSMTELVSYGAATATEAHSILPVSRDADHTERKSTVANGDLMGVKRLKGKPGSFVFSLALGSEAVGGSKPLRKQNVLA